MTTATPTGGRGLFSRRGSGFSLSPGARSRTRWLLGLALASAACLARVGPAAAEQGSGKTEVSFDAEARLRPESRSDADFNAAVRDDRSFVDQRIRLGVRLEKGRLSAYVQAQDSRSWGSEASTASNERNLDLHQGWVEWTDTDRRFRVRAGRQELAYGEERLVGAFNWSNIGRSFDAVRLAWSAERWKLDAFAARTASRGRTSDSQDLFGAYGSVLENRPASQVEAYLLWLRDRLARAGELPGAGVGRTSIWTAGGRVRGTVRGWSYGLELALQAGDRATDAHEAWALASRAGYRFRSPLKPYLGAGFDAASGDGDPADGDSGEFENLFPTNHAFYGSMDYVGWRNVKDAVLRFRIEPAEKVVVQADFHDFALEDPAGRWSDAGGATIVPGVPGGAAGSDLGRELDLTVRVSFEGWALEGGLSRFFAGEFPERASAFVPTAVRGDDSDWGYLMVTARF